MERERQGKNIVIAVLLVTVLCMSAAFAAFANIELQVDGTVNLPDAKWEVKFTDAAVVTAESDITTEPTHTDNTVTYTIDIEENQTYKIKATITNNGTYAAKVKTLTEPTIPTELGTLVKHEVDGLAEGDTIAAGASVDVTITVSMGAIGNDTLLTAVQNNPKLTLTLIAEFEQA